MSTSLPEQEKPIIAVETFLIKLYELRNEEILKRTGFQYQVIGLGLVVLGTILTIGLDKDSVPIILIYPLLAFFLASVWSQNDKSILKIREYIIAAIENKMHLPFKAWEIYRKGIQSEDGPMSVMRSSRRIFAGMQIIAILVASFLIWSHATISPVEIGLLILDILVVMFTTKLVKREEEKPAKITY